MQIWQYYLIDKMDLFVLVLIHCSILSLALGGIGAFANLLVDHDQKIFKLCKWCAGLGVLGLLIVMFLPDSAFLRASFTP